MPKLKPLYSGCIPQLSLPDECVGKLKMIFEDDLESYEIQHTRSFGTINKVASGDYVYVVRVAEPYVVYCFSSKAVRKPELARRVIPNFRNYGHSSLGFIAGNEDRLLGKPENVTWDEHFAYLAMPMLLAGHIYFDNQGNMQYWTVESGHYLPGIRDAFANRTGVVKALLPWSKFKPILFNPHLPLPAISMGWR